MNDEIFMREALREAELSLLTDDVPIGAVVVLDGEIIGRGHNMCEVNKDPTAHAEIEALRAAGEHIGSSNLEGATLYSTVEPCPMCAGALINARIKKVIYGTDEPKYGSAGSVLNILQFPGYNHTVSIVSGVCAEESRELLQGFFRRLRASK